jgi:hypothetical protein
VCNECGAIVPEEDVARLIMEMENCEATCPPPWEAEPHQRVFGGVRFLVPVLRRGRERLKPLTQRRFRAALMTSRDFRKD